MARKSRKNLPQPEQAAASVLLPELEEAKIPAAIYGRLSVEDGEKEESMETQIRVSSVLLSNYDLLLEDRSISLWSYNLETILAEKLQTVLARGILNTRMRDFYDIRMLLDTYEDKVNKAVLKDAFAATCKKRGTDHLQEQAEEIIKIIEADEQLRVLWRAYQKKYSYAAEIDYASVISGVRKLMDWIR